jgi:hypothetical protein
MFARPFAPTTVPPMLRRVLFAVLGFAGVAPVGSAAADSAKPAVPVASPVGTNASPRDGHEPAPAGAKPTPGATAADPRFARVEVAPTKTSIYVGIVSMQLPTFVRNGGTYETAYTASVFPLLFYGEKGRLFVEISDAQLEQLSRGETIEFAGHATRNDGLDRKVTGKATPTDATSGKLKVRVWVSKRIDLIFNTTYRFVGRPKS